MKFYKCPNCGKVKYFKDFSEAICCDKEMIELIPNSVDAAVEKHVPAYEVKGANIEVRVGEVEHPMSEEHYIVFIAMVCGDSENIKYLEPSDNPIVVFNYKSGSKIYAYCNLHGLWINEVK